MGNDDSNAIGVLKERMARLETTVKLGNEDMLREIDVLNRNFTEHKQDDKESFALISKTLNNLSKTQTEVKTTIKVVGTLIVFALTAIAIIHRLLT